MSNSSPPSIPPDIPDLTYEQLLMCDLDIKMQLMAIGALVGITTAIFAHQIYS